MGRSVARQRRNEPVLVQGLEAMNGAVDEDIVAVQLLETKAAPAEGALEDDSCNPGDTLEKEEKMIEKAVKSKDEQTSGRVMGIVKRKWTQYCGSLQPNPVKGSNRHIFVAAEKKLPLGVDFG